MRNHGYDGTPDTEKKMLGRVFSIDIYGFWLLFREIHFGSKMVGKTAPKIPFFAPITPRKLKLGMEVHCCVT